MNQLQCILSSVCLLFYLFAIQFTTELNFSYLTGRMCTIHEENSNDDDNCNGYNDASNSNSYSNTNNHSSTKQLKTKNKKYGKLKLNKIAGTVKTKTSPMHAIGHIKHTHKETSRPCTNYVLCLISLSFWLIHSWQ